MELGKTLIKVDNLRHYLKIYPDRDDAFVLLDGFLYLIGAMVWIHKQVMSGVNPRPILKDLIPDDTLIPDNLDDFTIWKIVINILSEPPPRKKLSHINTLQDVLHLLQTCQNIMVLTGAGVNAFTFLRF